MLRRSPTSQVGLFSLASASLSALLLSAVVGLAQPINSPTNALGTVGLPFSYQISTTSGATNYFATNLPPGLLPPGTNGLITGLPQVVGTSNSTVSAVNAGVTNSTNVAITINPPASPVLASPLTFFGMQGEPLRYSLLSVPNHSNVPTTFSVSGLPAGATLISNVTTNTLYTNVLVTNYFINAASLAANGSFVIPVVTRNAGGTNTNNVTFVISPATAPVITSTNVAAAIVGVPFSFDVTAINSPLRFRVVSVALGTNTNAPVDVTNGVLTNGLSFSNVSIGSYVVGRVSGTPAIATNVTLGLEAINNTLSSATQTLTINVGPPQPTVILTKPLGENFFAAGSSFFANAQAFDRLPDAIVPSSVAFTADGIAIPGIIGRLGDEYGVEFYPGSALDNPFDLTVTAQNNLGQTSTYNLGMLSVPPIAAFPEIDMLPLLPGPQIQAGGTVTLRARATSAQTPIQRVEFYVNKVYVGFSAAPVAGSADEYQIQWETPPTQGSYEINARVISQNGLFGAPPPTTPYYASVITREPVVLNTIPGVLPSVAIVTPTDGAQLPFNIATRVVASANVFNGSIQQVQFYVDGRPLGAADITAPYAVDFTPLSYGTYQLFAIATSSAGLINISPTVTVTVPELQGGNPTVDRIKVNNVDAESHDAQTGEILTFTTDADDADGNMVSVEFLANGVALPTPDAVGDPNPDVTAPYRYVFAPGAPGRYELVARATDNSGNVTDSEITVLTVTVGTPPTIKITAPEESPVPPAPTPVYDMLLNESVTIRAVPELTQPGSNVQRVEFLFNDQRPNGAAVTPSPSATLLPAGVLGPLGANENYNLIWRADNPGRYSVVARVTDNLGNVSDSQPIEINVTQGDAPTVSITTPLSTDTLTPGVPTTIVAEPVGKSGSVTQVEFFVNGVIVGLSAPPNAPPYVATFTPSAVGPYTLMARVTDSLGNVADSTKVTVNAAAPTGAQPLVSLTQPPASVLVTGSELYLNAVATNADGTPLSGAGSGVIFLVNGLPVAATVDLLKPNSYSARFTVGSSALYTIQAVATNGAGDKAASSQTIITARPRQIDLPQVQVLELLPGASTVAGGTVALRAQALFPLAALNTRVQFYGNGVLLGESAVPVGNIYTVNWTVPMGLDGESVAITARAVADEPTPVALSLTAFVGSTISSNTPTVVNLTTGPLPSVSITAPSGSIPVNVPVDINVAASVSPGTIATVDFYVNGVLIGTDNAFPFSLPWTPTSTGIYQLGAIVTSSAGIAKSVSSSVTVTSGNAIASVAIEAPVTTPDSFAMKINESVTLRANATAGAGRNIVAVEYYFNGLLVGAARPNNGPYTLNYPATRAGNYEVIARAVDDLGNEKDSAPIYINVTQGDAPTVSITTPLSTDTLTPGVPATIVANPVGKSGSVTQVEFFVNGAIVGVSAPPNAPPYVATFTPSAVGPYTLMARVTDSLGNVADSAKVTVNAAAPTGAQPLISLTQPVASNLVVGSELYLNATATNADGTPLSGAGSGVTFLVNGLPVAGTPDLLKPSSYSARFTVGSSALYVVQAVATNGAGNKAASGQTTITVAARQNDLPQVQVLELLPGSSTVAGGTIALRAQALFPAAAAANARVQFFGNGVLLGEAGAPVGSIYSFNWTVPLALDGESVNITARAIADNFGGGGGGGAAITAAITFAGSTISSNTPTVVNLTTGVVPTASITAPTGTIPVNVPANITVDASVAGGTIASVEYYVNGVLLPPGATPPHNLNPDNASPFIFTWTPTSPGIYTLGAIVTSSDGVAQTVSSTVTVTSGNPIASVQITAPTSPHEMKINETVTLRADAEAGAGRNVTAVEFYFNGLLVGRAAPNTGPYTLDYLAHNAGQYSVIARAVDDLGNEKDSDPIEINVTQGDAPTVDVTLAGPGGPVAVDNPNLQSILEAGKILFTFRRIPGADYVVEQTSDLVNGPWTPNPSLKAARAPVQPPGLPTGYEQAEFTVDPSGGGSTFYRVRFPEQIESALVGQHLDFSASVTLGSGDVQIVQFLVNGVPFGAPLGARPYTLNLPINAGGTYNVTARVTDSLGNVSESQKQTIVALQGAPPTVEITSPIMPATANVGETVRLAATANDPDGNVASVAFLVNGVVVATLNQASYVHDFLVDNPGVYTFIARATDDLGNITDSTPVILNAGLPVATTTVKIDSPEQATRFVPGTTFSALATVTNSLDHPVADVTYYLNGAPVGAALTQEPFTQQVTLTNSGNYTLTAIASDIYGNAGTDSVAIVCQAPPAGTAPIINMTHPVPGGGQDTVNDFSTPSQFYFNAIVTLPAGVDVAPNGVKFFASGQQVNGPVTRIGDTYAVYWQPERQGNFLITAQVTDSRGFTAVSEDLFFSIDPPVRPLPTIEIKPLASSQVTAGSTVHIQTVSNQGLTSIDRIDFYANGVFIGTEVPDNVNNADVTTVFSWIPTESGNYELSARAMQVLGEQGDNSVISTPVTLEVLAAAGEVPNVQLSPQTIANARYVQGSDLFLNATAESPGSLAISNVSFYFGDDILEAKPSGVQSGAQEIWAARGRISEVNPTIPLFAVAQDANFNAGSSDVTTFAGVRPLNPLPDVEMLELLPGAPLEAGGEVTLRARAVFPAQANEESRVEFYANKAFVGFGSVDPDDPQVYTLVWDAPEVEGAFVVEARAVALNFTVDTGDGNEVRNFAAVISANQTEVNTIPGNKPTVAITSPSNGAEVAPNIPLTVRADASVQASETLVTAPPASDGAVIENPGGVNVVVGQTVAANAIVVITDSGVIRTPVAGVVAEIFVSDGDTLSAGESLMRIYASSTLVTTPAAAAGAVIENPGGVNVVVGQTVAANAILVITDSGVIRTPVAGIVAEIFVKDGDTLSAGDSVARITSGNPAGIIERVEFYSNGLLLGTDTTAPYDATFTPQSAGIYNLAALAYSQVGLVGTSEVVTVFSVLGQAPSVEITSPRDNLQTPLAPVNIFWTGDDVDGAVVQTELLVNGLSVYSTPTGFGYHTYTFPSEGRYQFVVRATDNLGNVTDSDPVNVTVDNAFEDPAPIVVVDPRTIVDQGYVVGSQMYFNATAVARGTSDILTNSVEFLLGTTQTVPGDPTGILYGTNTVYASRPYAISSGTPTAFRAQAEDSGGNIGFSDLLDFYFSNPASPLPSVEILDKSPGEQEVAGGVVQLRAKAVFPVSQFNGAGGEGGQRVEFYADGAFLGNALPNTNTSTSNTFTHFFNWTTPTNTNSYQVTARVVQLNFNSPDSANSNAVIPFYGSTISPDVRAVNTFTNQPPTVSITRPSNNNTQVGVGTTNQVIATVTNLATNASVMEVQFYVNGIFQTNVTTFPYIYNFAPTNTGLYSLAAVVVDNFGLQGSSDVRTVSAVSGSAPTVTLSAPTNGVVGGTARLVATATDTDGTIAEVDFLVNGVPAPVPALTNAPYVYNLPLNSAGRYVLEARAKDNVGNFGFSDQYTLNVGTGLPPVVNIVSPTNNSTLSVGVPVTLVANASDADGSVTSVAFRVNGTAFTATQNLGIWSAQFTPTSPGTYRVVATAMDNSGNEGISTPEFKYTIPTETGLTVNMVSPPDGSIYTLGTPVVLNALPSVTVGTVTSVQFYVNGSPVGPPVTTAPYTIAYNPPTSGSYTVFATATDSSGNVAISTPRDFSVDVAPPSGVPSIFLSAPQGTFLTRGSQVYLNYTVILPDGSDPVPAQNVQIYIDGTAVPQSDIKQIGPKGDTYSYRWIVGNNANFTVYATVVDPFGTTGFSGIITFTTAQPQRQRPVVEMLSFVAPNPFFAVGVPATLRARANFLNNANPTLEFYANGVLLGAGIAGAVSSGWTTYSYEWVPDIPSPAVTITARGSGENTSILPPGGEGEPVWALASVISGNTVTPPVTNIPIQGVPEREGSKKRNDQFVLWMFDKLLYREPTYPEYTQYLSMLGGDPAASASAALKAQVVMRIMGFDQATNLFSPESEYSMTSAIAFALYGRLQGTAQWPIEPTTDRIINFISLMESDPAPLPLNGDPTTPGFYAGFAGAPWRATYGMARAMQSTIFDSVQFQNAYPTVSGLFGMDFVLWMGGNTSPYYAAVMFPGRPNGGNARVALANMIDDAPTLVGADAFLIRQGAGAAFQSEFVSTMLWSGLAGTDPNSVEKNFQLKLNSAALEFQLTEPEDWDFSTAPPYSSAVVQNILVENGYADP